LKGAYKGRAKDFVTAAGEHGVIMLMAGPDVLRFVPSLVMPEDDMNEGFARLAKAFATIAGTQTTTA
jgi:succinylornithine aminotransferase